MASATPNTAEVENPEIASLEESMEKSPPTASADNTTEILEEASVIGVEFAETEVEQPEIECCG